MVTQTEPPISTQGGAFPSAPEKADLGQILLRNGVVRREHLEECLRIQRVMAGNAGTQVPRLGELLVQKGYTTREMIERALGEQSKKVLFCPRCNILVNVDVRPDAIGYKCGRCEAPLVEPPAGKKDACIESSIIVNSKIPLPTEVKMAREDPSRRFGKYVILAEIGRGGIAAVYRAWDTYLNQYVALKRIKQVSPGQGAGTIIRHSRIASLLNEAHNAIKLRHPNIVSIYDIGRIENEYYISMEYLEGRTMLEEIQEIRHSGKVSPYHEDPRKWLGVLYQISHALHYAHTRPFPTLHCDLKPGNIFVAKDGRACVLDFGLARQLGEFQNENGTISGTPSYMSPEQASGRVDQLDPRTDVYGMGAILYELLAGRPPFTGEITEVLRRTIEDKPMAPTEIAWGPTSGTTSRRTKLLVPPELESLCMRCLEKEPSKRPTTSLEFAEAISAISGGGKGAMPKGSQTTIHSLPQSPARRSSAFSKAAPWLLLLMLVPSVAVATWVLHPRIKQILERDQIAPKANAHLAAFRPDLVYADFPAIRTTAGTEEVIRRLDAILQFKQELLEAISTKKPKMTELKVGTRTLKDVKLFKAKSENLLFTAGVEPEEAPWSDVGAPGIVAIAKAVGITEKAPARFGLAVFCFLAGSNSESRELFKTLISTEYGPNAREFMSLLEGR